MMHGGGLGRRYGRKDASASLCLFAIAAAIVAACGKDPGAFDSPAPGATNDASAAPSGGDDGGGAPGTFGGGGAGDASGPSGSGPGPGCDPTCLAIGACVNGTCVASDNPGNVSPGTQGQLGAGGHADSAFRWLYPYDRTVFPRGLVAPTLQLDGSAPDAMLVHVSFSGFDYKGYYGASSPARATFSGPVWTAITSAAKGTDAVKVEITKIAGGQVTGPIAETWTIAQGSLRGTIYYETYDSKLAGAAGIMKVQPGATAPTVVKAGCGNVCHTASADGSTLVAATQIGTSASYDLKTNAAGVRAEANDHFTYGALYPDGSFLMSATNYRTWLFDPSRLYDTKTGATIAAPGWDGKISNGGTPAFSPDGKKIAFNHEDTAFGHTLAVMDFDVGTKTFSNLIDIATDSARTLGWPAFTPDTKWVVFHAGSNAQFETDQGATGDLFVTDLATHTVARLDAADGYAGAQTYLPAQDPQLSFAPTVLPEAVGGYFWAVFTSHRSYGNTLASKDHNDEYGKLWVTAIDLSPTAGKDPSHPAFFLDGQELASDNLRGFWVLDPCRQQGEGCQSADQCCGGFCRPADDGGLQCMDAPPKTDAGGCSQEFEKCSTAADCCDTSFECINQRCARPPPR